MKRTAMGHPKLVGLAALLNVPQYAAVGIMESVWHFTAKHAITGNIGKWTDEEIAGQIGWEVGDAERLIEALVACRLVDHHSKHRLVVHDWHEHCDESVTKTLRNKHLSFANRDPSEPLTTPEAFPDSRLFENFRESGRNFPPKPSHSQAEPEPKPEPKPSPSSSKLRSDPEDREFATFMLDRIRKLLPNFKQPNLEAWGNTIRLSREADGRTLEELKSVFLWATADQFWKGNILSPTKLREKFDQLKIKSKGPTNGTTHPAAPSADDSPARSRSSRYADESKYRSASPAARAGVPASQPVASPLAGAGGT
jgi:hypothetical protein